MKLCKKKALFSSQLVSLISARFVKENVGTGEKSSWTGINLQYVRFKLLVDTFSPVANIDFKILLIILNLLYK